MLGRLGSVGKLGAPAKRRITPGVLTGRLQGFGNISLTPQFVANIAGSGVLAATPTLGANAFAPLKVGGGGYVTAIRISSDGNTRMVRTDTFSSYRWNSSTNYWDATAITGKFPAGDIGIDNSSGCYEIAIAPSNSSIVYQYTFYVHKSTDGGQTFVRCTTSPAGGVFSDPNAQQGVRMVGPKMAVHPTDPNTVYVMTQANGLYYTQNGGSTWTKETTVPTQGNSGTVAFSSTGSNIYVSAAGSGLYKGTPGGAFAAVTGGPGATGNFMMCKVAANGTLYITNQNFAVASKLWRFADPTWTDITPAGASSLQCVVCDPSNSSRVLVGNSGGQFYFTQNATVATPTWSSLIPLTRTTGVGEPPWLATTAEGFMSEGDAQFDPVVSNRLWFAEGIGVWYADVTATAPSTMAWQSQNKGIEGMVATSVIATPAGALVTSQWDRGLFKLDPANPNSYPANQTYDTSVAINHCWFVDWASSDPTFLVAYLDKTQGSHGPCFSSDSGATWSDMTLPPSAINLTGGFGGSIVAASSTNWLLQPQWNNDLFYTTNAGSSWTKIAIAGVPANNGSPGNQGTNETGWGKNSNFGGVRHHAVCADRGTSGTFYAMNTGGAGDASYAGVYRSTDGGATWTKRFAGNLTAYTRDFWNVWIKSVPNITSVNTTGHLFYTSGQASGGSNPDPGSPFLFSRDGGATWTAVSGVFEVYAFGFGAAAPGKNYPTLFIAGWVSGTWGIYKAEANDADWAANTATFSFAVDYPYGWTDEIRTIDGDKINVGRMYMGFGGSSFAYGVPPTIVIPPSGFPVLTNLIGHWRADRGVTLSGSNVTSVAAQDGSSLPLVNVGTVPFNATGSVHGQPAFSFVAANSAALGNSSALPFANATSTLSIFIVGQMLSNTQSFGGLAAMTATAASNDYQDVKGFAFTRDTSTNNLIATQNNNNTSDAAISLATQYRFGLILNGATSTIYINNVAVASGTSALNTSNTNNFLVIGGRILAGVNSTTSQWEGPISDIVITNSALSATERNNLDAYFTATWGT